MRSLLVLLVALAVAASAALLNKCTRSGILSSTRPIGQRFPWWNSDENASWKYAHPDLCVAEGWERPYCIPITWDTFHEVHDRANWDWGCAQCRHSCDCKIGEYCQNADPTRDDYGLCLSYTAHLGQTCDGSLWFQSPAQDDFPQNQKVLWYSSKIVCAHTIEVTDPVYNHSRYADVWTGTCIHGRCKECNSYVRETPSHDPWYTNSEQQSGDAHTLRCLWDAIDTPTVPQTSYVSAGYKHKPRICEDHQLKYTNGVAVVAPAAVLLLAAALAL